MLMFWHLLVTQSLHIVHRDLSTSLKLLMNGDLLRWPLKAGANILFVFFMPHLFFPPLSPYLIIPLQIREKCSLLIIRGTLARGHLVIGLAPIRRGWLPDEWWHVKSHQEQSCCCAQGGCSDFAASSPSCGIPTVSWRLCLLSLFSTPQWFFQKCVTGSVCISKIQGWPSGKELWGEDLRVLVDNRLTMS